MTIEDYLQIAKAKDGLNIRVVITTYSTGYYGYVERDDGTREHVSSDCEDIISVLSSIEMYINSRYPA